MKKTTKRQKKIGSASEISALPRSMKSTLEQRNTFLSTALDRYAIPFVRNLEARLVRWQATL